MACEESTVAVLMFDRAPIFETSVPLSVFGMDRSASGAPKFTLMPVAAEDGPLVTTGGLQIAAPHGLDDLERAAIVIVPSWRDPAEPPPEPALDALRAAHDRGSVIVSLCLGAFVLAATGLLDGRRAATHWFYARELAALYPSVTVDPSVLFVDDGDLVTSGGTGAALDACLHLVRRTWGAKAASAIARRMAMPPQRSGGYAQVAEPSLRAPHPADDLSRVMNYAIEHIAEAVDVEDLARQALLSRRSFDRRFRAAAGVSPLQWLLHQRMLRAQRLLEETTLPVEEIARQVGLASGLTLRRNFHRLVGLSPQQYRQRFRVRQDA